LVEFSFTPEKFPTNPHTPKAFSFAPHTLHYVAQAVKKMPPSKAQIPLLPDAKKLGTVLLFDIPN